MGDAQRVADTHSIGWAVPGGYRLGHSTMWGCWERQGGLI